MRSVRLFFVQLPTAAYTAALAAARTGFPGANVFAVGTVEEAGRQGRSGCPELLVLPDSSSAETAHATQITDENGLPRWAVVVLGRNMTDLAETVPPENWNPPMLTHVFRSALLQHELLRENLCLRGDLKSVARRFTHDLYTPVGCIHTSAAVLKNLSPDDVRTTAEIIQNIEDSSAEISQLVERISFVLRASAEPCVPAEVEMGEVVDAVLNQLGSAIRKTGATMVAPPSWPRVSGIPNWLKIIWWNLLSNALQHGGPSVRIRIGWNSEENRQRFSVVDSGPGVSTEIRPGLFRPFNQLHTLRAKGLGLSIVQRLTALQGGTCGCDPLPEGGTRFYFTLPAEKSGSSQRTGASLHPVISHG